MKKKRKETTGKEKENQNDYKGREKKKMRERMEFRWDRVDSMDLYINEQGREGVRKHESERESETKRGSHRVKKKWTNCACLHGNEWNLISSSGKWMERTKSRRGKKERKKIGEERRQEPMIVSWFLFPLFLCSSSFFLSLHNMCSFRSLFLFSFSSSSAHLLPFSLPTSFFQTLSFSPFSRNW